MVLMENDYSRMVMSKYGPMLFFKYDDPIGTCLTLYGEWAEQEFDVISQLVTPTTNCIDIGSNIGTHSVWLSKKCKNGVVFSIEPQFYIFNFLTTNLMLNDCLNCFPLKAFISNVDSKFIGAPIMGPSSDKYNYGEYNINLCSKINDGIPTQAIRLDDIEYMRKYDIGFIKMDCEGTETDVFTSGHNILTKNKPNLYIEHNGVNGHQSVVDILNEYGYNCYWHVYPKHNIDNHNKFNQNIYLHEHEMNLIPTVKIASRLFESNLVCIHKDKDQGAFQDKVLYEDSIIKWLLRNNWIVE